MLPSDPDARTFDVIIIGSGPAGTAVAEGIVSLRPDISIAVIERGSVLLQQHYYRTGGSIAERDHFLQAHKYCPWVGDLSAGGALIPCVGGRGIVGGSQLHRFYTADLMLWPEGRWAISSEELRPFFAQAENNILGEFQSTGSLQKYVQDVLQDVTARHPPHSHGGQPPDNADSGFPHRSATERILRLAALKGHGKQKLGGVHLLTDVVALRLVSSKTRPGYITHVHCSHRTREGARSVDISAASYVLAASPIESARLLLNSNLEVSQTKDTVVGRYLAEHIYCRGLLDISASTGKQLGTVSVVVPPANDALQERFHIEIRSVSSPDGSTALRVTGSAAMDPSPSNRVRLSLDDMDSNHLPRATTVLRFSDSDMVRMQALHERIQGLASRLGGRWIQSPQWLPKGGSYHEVGTIRASDNENLSAAHVDGRVMGTQNVFVGDGSIFPCVGVANPILTLTALGYRLADRLTQSG